jgi:HD-like signal output (HDOD) protein
MASRIVSKRIRHPQIEEAFIVGLMHDLGKLILSQKLSEQYEIVCKKVESEGLTFMEVENEQLGFGHVEVGRLLFERWNFPSMLTSAISNHHDPRHDDSADTENLVASSVPIAFITQFCNELAKKIDCGFDDRHLDDLTSLPLAQIAGFEQIDIDNFVEELDEAYQSESNLFEE